MATALFAKLNNIFGFQQSYTELYAASVSNASHLSRRLFDSLTAPNPQQFEEGHTVAIVGGGLAGLSAAYYLLQEGVDVTLFEAGGQPGGRVKTDTDLIPGRRIEAGAELIGLNHSLWLTLARDLGLSMSTVTPELHYVGAQLDIYVDLDEEPPDPNTTLLTARGQRLDQLRQLHHDSERIYSRLNDLAQLIDPFRPWHGPAVGSFDDTSVAQWVSELRLEGIPNERLALAKEAVLEELENDQCVPAENQSLLGLLAAVRGGALTQLTSTRPSEYWTHSEVFKCAEGNQMLAHRILAHCRDNFPNSFQYRPRTVVNQLDFPFGFKQLIWGPTKEERASYNWVIFAVPSPLIFPEQGAATIVIPADKRPPRVPQNGKAVKYLTHLENRFWMEHPNGTFAPSAFSGVLGSFWEPTDNQNSSSSGGFGLSLFSGSHRADSVVGFDAQNKLPAQISEIYSQYTTSTVSAQLENWPEEAHIRTGYSCPRPGEITAIGDFYCRHHDGVIFAGEYTSAPFFGYMEGALQSGLRAAMLVLGKHIVSSQRFSQEEDS